MPKNLSQAKAIDNLIKYLDYHNIPLQINKNGICNGLVNVHSRYVLEGREDEFFTLLEHISGDNVPWQIPEDKINQFITDFIISFFPQEYDSKLSQHNSYLTQLINNKPLKCNYELPLVTHRDNWSKILQDINLHEDEVMVVAGINHVVSIHRKHGQYVIYDPNYPTGRKYFSNESDVMLELQTNVFLFKTDELGLKINILSDPNKNLVRQNPYPEVEKIYDTYLTEEKVSNRAVVHEKAQASTIEFACLGDNEDLVSKLLLIESDPKNIQNGRENAVKNNNVNSLRPLIVNLENGKFAGLFVISFIYGRNEVFKELMKHENGRADFDILLASSEFRPILLGYAAQGGNDILLEKLIVCCEDVIDTQQLLKELIKKNDDGNDSIMNAILGKNPKCLRVLLDKLDELHYQFDDKAKVDYLLFAVRQNKPYMVEELLNKMNITLDNTTLDSTLTEKTDVNILKLLKVHGMKFSAADELVIAKKEHKTEGFKFTFGLILAKFTEFFRVVIWANIKDKFMTSKQNLDIEVDHRVKESTYMEGDDLNPNGPTAKKS